MLLSFKNIATILILFLLSWILAHLIIENNYRIIILIFFLPLLIYKIISASTKEIVNYIIIASFIPIKLNVSTTNIGSISQYICCLGFGAFFLKTYFLNKKISLNKKIFPLVFPLIFIGAISTLNLLPSFALFRTSFWNLILLISTVLFLLLLDSITFRNDEEKHFYIIRWVDLIIFCMCIQILFGALVYYFPNTGGWFKIFFSASNETGLQSTITENNLIRLRTFSLPTEAVGEFCAMLIPYAAYRLTFQKSWPYIPGILILLAGVALSGTRSAAILSILAIFAYYGFVEKSIKIRLLHLSILIATITMLVIFEIGTSTIITRFSSTYEVYATGADMGTVLNRKFLFKENWIFFYKNLSFFGNGLVSPVAARYLFVDFHNIYLTIVYQFGIIGSVFYFMLPLTLLTSLFKVLQKHGEQTKLTKVYIISLLIFLINETKFEFTRKNDYVLIVWILLSIFYLHTKQFSKKENFSRNLKNASPYTHTL